MAGTTDKDGGRDMDEDPFHSFSPALETAVGLAPLSRASMATTRCTATEMLHVAETFVFSDEFEAWAGTMQGRAAERIRQVRNFVPRAGSARPSG